MKTLFLILTSTILLANIASAQSLSELREELERERIITEIAIQRSEREALHERRYERNYKNEMNDIYIEREQYARRSQERSGQLRNANELMMVIGNSLRYIDLFR